MPGRERGDATNVEVVTWALALLGGASGAVHLEDVSVKAFELKPGAFRWDQQAYAKHIDKDKVRVSLTDAAKSKYGALTRAVGKDAPQISKTTDWWRLTPSGTRWVSENEPRLVAIFESAPPGLKREAARQVRQRIERSELFREFATTGRVTEDVYGLADLVECSPDARLALFRSRFETLQSEAIQLGDSKLQAFLNEVRTANQAVLGAVDDNG